MGQTVKIAALSAVVIAMGASVGGYMVYSKVQQKLAQSEKTFTKIEKTLAQQGLILDHTRQTRLFATEGELHVKDVKKQAFFNASYKIEHPLSSWFGSNPLAFTVHSSFPSITSELNIVQGSMDFDGSGSLDGAGAFSLQLKNAKPFLFKVKNTPGCPQDQQTEPSKTDPTFELTDQTLAFDTKADGKGDLLSASYSVGKLTTKGSPKETMQWNDVSLNASINLADPMVSQLDIKAKTITLPEEKFQLNDVGMKMSVEKNAKNSYDFIMGGGIRSAKTPTFNDDIGFQLLYSLRGLTAKTMNTFTDYSRAASSATANVKTCESISPEAAAKLESQLKTVLDTMGSEMLTSGFSTNIDMIKIGNAKSFVEGTLKLNLQGVTKKELASVEDNLNVVSTVKVKGDMAQMVIPFLDQAQAMGLTLEPTTVDGALQIALKLSYDAKKGFSLNDGPALDPLSLDIKKALREVDRKLNLQNRPALTGMVIADAVNEPGVVIAPATTASAATVPAAPVTIKK